MKLNVAQAWKRFRSRYWLSLTFDVAVIIVAFWAIHAWNTRHLPLNEPAPPLPVALLDAGMPVEAMPAGQAGVVYFFAPWCFYCRTSIDNLDDLVEGGEISWARAVALDYGGVEEVRTFVAETGLGQPVLLGDGRTARDWNIRAFPTYFVIDAKGRIASRSVGYSTSLGLRARARLAR